MCRVVARGTVVCGKKGDSQLTRARDPGLPARGWWLRRGGRVLGPPRLPRGGLRLQPPQIEQTTSATRQASVVVPSSDGRRGETQMEAARNGGGAAVTRVGSEAAEGSQP